MRNRMVLVALVVVMGGLAATAHAETLYNAIATPSFFTNGATVAGSTFSGGAYALDAALDNDPNGYTGGAAGMSAAADWVGIQMGNDATNLYVYVHYNNNGTNTINPYGSMCRYSDIDITSDYLGAGTTIDGVSNVNFRISGIYDRSNSLTFQSWNGTSWTTVGNPSWGSATAVYAMESNSSYYIDYEFAVPLSAIGVGANGPAFNWVGYTKNTYSTPNDYDYYASPASPNRYAATPEPGTLALLAAGLVGMLVYAWRKRK